MTQNPGIQQSPVGGWARTVEDGRPVLGRAAFAVPVLLLGSSLGISGAFAPWLQVGAQSALGVLHVFGVVCLLLSVLAAGLILPAARAVASVRARRILGLVSGAAGVAILVLSLLVLLRRESVAKDLFGLRDVEVQYGLVMVIVAGALIVVGALVFAFLVKSRPAQWQPVFPGDPGSPEQGSVESSTSAISADRAPVGWGPPRV